MALVYGMAILESMVKDYSRYLMLNERSPATTLPAEHSMLGNEPPTLLHEHQNPRGLQLGKWKKMVENWADAVRYHAQEEFARDDRRKKVVKALVAQCDTFQYWQVLITASVIRDCVIHSDGLMNKLAHKKAPLCDVEIMPDWGFRLVYDMFATLDILNDHLSITEI